MNILFYHMYKQWDGKDIKTMTTTGINIVLFDKFRVQTDWRYLDKINISINFIFINKRYHNFLLSLKLYPDLKVSILEGKISRYLVNLSKRMWNFNKIRKIKKQLIALDEYIKCIQDDPMSELAPMEDFYESHNRNRKRLINNLSCLGVHNE